MRYTAGGMNATELWVLAKGLGPLAGAVAWVFVSYYGLLKLIDHENRRADAAASARRAWLDPDLRRN